MTEHPEGTHVGTQGESPTEVVGLRNQLRAKWRGQSQEVRIGVSLGVAVVLSILFYFVDPALGVAAFTITALYWIRRLPPLPWRLAAQAALVGAFLIFGPRSFACLLAIVFALFWLPERTRRWALPLVALVLTVLYPFYQDKMFTIPVFGVWPDVFTGVIMVIFVMMAVGLNIVVGYAGLLDLGYVAFYATGAYTAAWFASEQFPTTTWHLGSVGIAPNLPGIHVTIWPLLLLAGIITAVFGIVIGLPTLRLRGDPRPWRV